MKKIDEQPKEETPVVDAPKPLTVKLQFVWQMFTPDPRAYKPSAPVLSPFGVQKVVLEVPLTSEFIDNAQAIILGQLATDSTAVPEPILTLTGMRYCIDLCESVMANPDNGKPHNEFNDVPDTKSANVSTDTEWSDEDDWDNKSTNEPVKNDPVPWDDDETWQ